MRIAAIAFTESGMTLGERLKSDFPDLSLTRCKSGMLDDWTKTNFKSAEALLFIGAVGIAVRAIAPYVRLKTEDPAVVVVDELGTFSIPILSGHIGGANELAREFSNCIGSISVITTGTDINHIFEIDTWAKRQGLIIANPERIKYISASLLLGESIHIKSFFRLIGVPPTGVIIDNNAYDVLITYEKQEKSDALLLIAPVITLGIGCKKGVDADTIETAFKLLMEKTNCYESAVSAVASIDIKENEPGMLEFCKRRKLPLRTFSAIELAAVNGNFTSSVFVKETIGVDNVCERAAVLESGGSLLIKKEAGNGVTMALAIKEKNLWLGEKNE
ncbi:MAG: cobalt-precorrin 5A hydrolase [Clostridia bacterium]